MLGACWTTGSGGGMIDATGSSSVEPSVFLIASMFCCIVSLYRYCILQPTPESSISAEATMLLYLAAVNLGYVIFSEFSDTEQKDKDAFGGDFCEALEF